MQTRFLTEKISLVDQVIFRGGRRFSAEEKTLWNKDVDVFFQEKVTV